MTDVDPLNMHTDATPLNMHTDTDPLNMHTDGGTDTVAGTVLPFNMHTDMVIGSGSNGRLHLSAKNSSGRAMAVTITAAMAHRLGTVLGLSGPPTASPTAPAPVSPFNMHTDAQTHISANDTRSQATLLGPADGPNGAERLKITIDGPALATVKGSHAGI